MKELEEVVAIVLNYNNSLETIECVTNILTNIGEMKIIIVDNNSTDNSLKNLFEQFEHDVRVKIIKSKYNLGYAAGNNLGIKYVIKNLKNVNFFTIMNPDTRILSENLILNLMTEMKQDESLAVIAPLMKYNGKIDYDMSAWNVPSKKELIMRESLLLPTNGKRVLSSSDRGIVKVGAVSGAFFMIRKEAIIDIGFFDERTFLYGEESILGRDLAECGYYEAIYCEDFYVHNHKSYIGKWSLKKRIITRWNKDKYLYESRKVYCHKYFKKKESILLCLVHYSNIILYPFVFLQSVIKRKISKGEI